MDNRETMEIIVGHMMLVVVAIVIIRAIIRYRNGRL